MKGAMADPSSLLSRRLSHALYPGTTYGNNSGGEPADIPGLTHQALREFHHRYYHPSNCFLCTYGNLPIEEHLAYIEKNALSRFSPLEVDSSVPCEERYPAPQRFDIPFPVDAGESLHKRSMVQVGWLAAPIENLEDNIALNVLASLLIGNPSAPLYKALLDSDLGLNLAPGTGFHDDLRESFFAAGLQGTEAEHGEKIEQLVLETLSACRLQGFSQKQIDAAIHQLEFSFREVGGDAYPYGLTLLIRLLASWLHSEDPVAPLKTLDHYERIRTTAIKEGLFEQLIQHYLLDNPHRVTLTLFPDIDLQGRLENESRKKLDQIAAELTAEDKQRLVEQAEELQRNQEDPGDLERLPTLELKDIPLREADVTGTTFAFGSVTGSKYSQPTNGIAYLTLRFDLAMLDDETRPYAPLFGALLPQVGAAGDSYLVMSERIAATSGGIRASAQVIEDALEHSHFSTCLEVRAKALYRNYEAMLGVLEDMLLSADFNDLERIHRVINQARISMENGIPASGHSYAVRVAAASLSASGRLKESWNGIEQLRLIRSWAERPHQDLQPLADMLHRVKNQLIRRDQLRVLIVAEADTIDTLVPGLQTFVGRLPASAISRSPNSGNHSAAPAYKGWLTNSPVAYVARVFPTIAYGHPDAPALAVLSRLLRAGFLHREIRERGGAYGGLVSNDPLASQLSMVSYRDPHISRTLSVFEDAAHWAARGEFSDNDIREAILSCFSEIDRPNSPAGRAYREFNCLEQGLTREIRQRYREGILAVDRDKLVSAAKSHLLDNWSKSAVAVLAGDELMAREKDRLTPPLPTERI